ncbi:MAG: sigma factor [Polyangiaceae bacterium]
MSAPANTGGLEGKQWLSSAELRRDVERAVRRRVRGDEADDVVQATWADVLQAASVPADAEQFRRFVFGVARHKVYDHFRRRAREVPDGASVEQQQAPEALSDADILRWAEGQLPDPDAKNTLEWMLREADGEKLEHIARDENLPATRVRKRVSRLRRLLRERWAAEALLGVTLLMLGGSVAVYRHYRIEPQPHALPEIPAPRTPLELARELRRGALERCRTGDPRECLDDLDRARALDPQGDGEASVSEARRIAGDRIAPAPAPSAPAPLDSAPPPAKRVPYITSPAPTAQRAPRLPPKASLEMPSDTLPPQPSDAAPSKPEDRKESERIDLDSGTDTKAKAKKAPAKPSPAVDPGDGWTAPSDLTPRKRVPSKTAK